MRRKVSNLLGLAILSVLVQKPMHPYEMAAVLRARGKDDDMAIKWGSLYTVVRNLEKHGLIESTGSGRTGARPERTTYRITGDGRAELKDWTRELVATPVREPLRFTAALSVLGALDPDEAATLLRDRLTALRAQVAELRARLGRDAAGLPRLFTVETEYELAMRVAEEKWVAALAGELADGTFPGRDAWAEYHRTGEVPDNLADR